MAFHNPRQFVAALLLLALVVTVHSPISAQDVSGVTEIPDPAMVVKQIRLVEQTSTKAVAEIEFYPRLPPYRLQRDLNERRMGQRAFLLTFENARLSANSLEPRLRGLLVNFAISEEGRDLTLDFGLADPSRASVEPVSDTTLRLTINRVPLRNSSSFGDFGDEQNTSSDDTGLDDYADYEEPAEQFELIRLKYADVSEVVGLLTEGITVRPNNTLIRRQPGFGSIGINDNNSSGNNVEENNDQPLGEAVDRNLAIDRRLNAIWVRGTRAKIELVKRQIELIDVPVDSVILETEFVELTETGSRNLGIDFSTGSGGQIGSASLRLGESVPFNANPTQIQESFSLQAALYAQIQKGEGRIISKPRISAQSGATAKIITGDSLPILTSITLSGVDGVSEQVNYVNVGVTLQIAPRVSPDGFVTSKIFTVVSSVTGFSQGFPTISQREAETSASVRDGESFVIGGLVQESSLISKSKIPLLGDIPLLGSLFSRETASNSKTELYIIITPRIVRHGNPNASTAPNSRRASDRVTP
jgi:general secretion pathway protein D